MFDFTTLYTKLGNIIARFESVTTLTGTTMPAGIDTLYSFYTTTSDEPTIDGFLSQLTDFQNAQYPWLSALFVLAQNTIITDINNYQAQNNRSFNTALTYLVQQMRLNNITVQANAVSISQTPAGSNVGNPNFVFSTLTRNGLVLENLFPETITAVTTNDSFSGSATAGSETLTFTGQQAVNNGLSWQWPGGSGCVVGVQLVDASNTTGGNNVVNGDFENWTSNTPNNWHITTGTAGTQVLQEAHPYTGTYSMGLVGDGSTLTAVEQEFAVDNATTITTGNQYCVNTWVMLSATASTGTLELALVDGSGNIILDAQGHQNATNYNLSTFSHTTWTPISATFRTPFVLPTSIWLRVRYSAPAAIGVTTYVDRLAFAPMLPLYLGGPYVAGFSGSTPSVTGDNWSVVTANNYAGGFQTWFGRVFPMRQLKLLLPSVSSSPVIPNSLIA